MSVIKKRKGHFGAGKQGKAKNMTSLQMFYVGLSHCFSMIISV